MIFQAFLYEEAGNFTVAQSLNGICDKLIRRHPHVFAESEGKSEMHGFPQSENELLMQWESIKENLEGRKGKSPLDTVPKGFPPLLRAYKMLKKAAKKEGERYTVPEAAKMLSKRVQAVSEAADVVEMAKSSPTAEAFTASGGNEALDRAQLALEAEVGEAIFSLVNYSRLLGVDPVLALDRANRNFYERFTTGEEEWI